jgi:hypothetical protein
MAAPRLVAWVGATLVALMLASSAHAQGLNQFPSSYFSPFKFTCDSAQYEVTPIFAGPEYCKLPVTCTTAVTMGTKDVPLAFSAYAGDGSNSTNYASISYLAGKVQAPMSIVLGNVASNGLTGRPTGKIQFWIETDKFSLLDVVGSTGVEFVDPGYNVTGAARDLANQVVLKVEFAGFTTPPVHRALVTVNDDLIAPFWTAIIVVDRGVVTGLEWDNSCSGCSDVCIRSVDGAAAACGITREKCKSGADNINCDVKVYVGWRGTDAKGNYLLSSQSALSNFRAFAAKIAYDSLAKTASQIAEGFPDSSQLPSIPDLPSP